MTGDLLIDEKILGTVHIALGSWAYPECGGVNESSLHWDMVKDLRVPSGNLRWARSTSSATVRRSSRRSPDRQRDDPSGERRPQSSSRKHTYAVAPGSANPMLRSCSQAARPRRDWSNALLRTPSRAASIAASRPSVGPAVRFSASVAKVIASRMVLSPTCDLPRVLMLAAAGRRPTPGRPWKRRPHPPTFSTRPAGRPRPVRPSWTGWCSAKARAQLSATAAGGASSGVSARAAITAAAPRRR